MWRPQWKALLELFINYEEQVICIILFINWRSQQIQCVPQNLCSWTVPSDSYGEKHVCRIRLILYLWQYVIGSPALSLPETDPQKCRVMGQEKAQVGNYKVTVQLVDTEGNPLSMSLGSSKGFIHSLGRWHTWGELVGSWRNLRELEYNRFAERLF